MKAFRRLFSVRRHLGTAEPACQYQGMALRSKEKLDITSRYQMNSAYEIPVLGYGVCSLLRVLSLLGCLACCLAVQFLKRRTSLPCFAVPVPNVRHIHLISDIQLQQERYNQGTKRANR